MEKPSLTNGVDLKHYLLDQAGAWMCLHGCTKGIPHADADLHHANIDAMKRLPPPDEVITMGQQMMAELYASMSNRVHPRIYASIYINIKLVTG